jgi:hypothetical protein
LIILSKKNYLEDHKLRAMILLPRKLIFKIMV